MFENIIALLKGGPQTAADLRKALDGIDVTKLKAIRAEAEANRRTVLLTGTPAELKAADVKLETARYNVERAEVAIEELAPRLAEAVARESDEAFVARHAELAAELAALSKRLRGDYATSAAKITAIAEAESDLARRVTAFEREIHSRETPVAGVTSFDRTAFAIAAGGDDSGAMLHTRLRLPAIDAFAGWSAP